MLSDVCLSVCLSVAYVGSKSRTERHRNTKIGTEVAHVTRDSDTTFKVTGRFAHRRVGASGGCSGIKGVGTCWPWETTATLRLLAWAPTGGGEGRGISCRHAHSLCLVLSLLLIIIRADVLRRRRGYCDYFVTSPRPSVEARWFGV